MAPVPPPPGYATGHFGPVPWVTVIERFDCIDLCNGRLCSELK